LSVNQTSLIELGAAGITGYPFTLTGWFRVPNVNVLLTLMGINNSTTGSYHRLVYAGHSSQSVGAISYVSTTSTAWSSIPMSTGQWHHVAGVFEAANLRRVYLDGGNVGTSSQNRVFDGANQTFVGSLGTNAVDVAEAAVFNVALTAGQVGQLARGFSPLCLPVAAHLAAYQCCMRHLNWPARGLVATASVAPTAVDHPRILYRQNFGARTMPLRRWAPFQLARGELHGMNLADGQPGQASQSGQAEGQIAGAGVNIRELWGVES
jgi:hypothetical protein